MRMMTSVEPPPAFLSASDTATAPPRRRVFGTARAARRRPAHPGRTWGIRLVTIIILGWSAGLVLGFVPAVMMLTLVGFAAAAAGIFYPTLGLFGVGLLTVLDPVTRHLLLGSGGLLRWNSFNYWLLIVTALFLPRVLRLSDPHSRLLRLLIIVMAVDLLLAPRWEAGLQTLLNVSTVFALVIYFQRSPRDGETMFWLGVVMSLAAAIGGAAFYRQPALLSAMNKNAFAMFPLAGVVGACLAFPFAANVRGGQLLLAGLAAVDVTWVFLSRSRGCLLAAVIAMVFLLLLARNVATRIVYVAAAALIAAGVAGKFGALEANATARFDKMMDSNVSLEERTSGRANLARGGWEMFVRHPLGVGTGAFEDAWASLEQGETSNQWAAGKFVPAHSAWVMVLAENGAPGILLLTMYVCSFAVIGAQRRHAYLVLLGLFVTTLLGVAFMANEVQSKALWFAAAGATAFLHPETGLGGRSRRFGGRRVRARPLATAGAADV
jgi:O-antigen ligase